ncbi:sugar phosphate isomerase/epimerase family protein [Fictibacillus aquaticus]|uniref:Xylose isomerase n=1 Tax=Fictibacillus aquaticus TaxID=2021314 RepID=A0A235F4R7_9BACL|nr:sugar phosphate isomerase/epimerase [Fictibacillus aquaticus]OYD56093.1 xylose isomerase [Fictibacillus aquaticus]
MKNIPIALQLYTLREASEKDFIGTLKRVADIGFDGVEFAGYGGLDTKELRNVIDSLGLSAASSHVPLEDLRNNLERSIEQQLILGSKYIVCPYLEENEREEKDYIQLIELLNRAGEKCADHGISLCYHNHDFELKKLSDGRTALQTILEETNPAWVQAEFDIYWITYAGQEPADWIKRYNNRTPLVHLKDMTTDSERFFAELGTGGVQLSSVLDIGEAANVDWWVVEQDVSRRDPFESVAISLDYLKK